MIQLVNAHFVLNNNYTLKPTLTCMFMHNMSVYTFDLYKLSVPQFLYKSFIFFNLKYLLMDVKIVYGV